MTIARILALLVVCAAALGAGVVSQMPTPPAKAGPAVEILVKDGLGSGVYIGNGYVITAGHVTDTADTVTIKDENDKTYDGEVLWANHKYDVALIRIKDASLAAATLDCSAARVGEVVHTRGNPMGVESITSWGHIAGKARKWGPWASVVFTDLSIAPGNSGGGIYDERGHVVGIAVGVMLARLGMLPTMTGFSTVVPSTVICELMAR